MTRLALLLTAVLPLAAAAEAPPPAAPAPAEALTAPKRPGVTVDWGGWLSLVGFSTVGGLDANDLPRAAVPPATERTFGMTARQSRLHAAVGLPADGLLGGATLDGFVEVDFAGPAGGAGQGLPALRFRQGWVSARWAALANLTVLAGQAWGLTGVPEGALSLGHLATPRFSGAGYLHRLAPQLRVSAETGGTWSVLAQAALLSPDDPATTPAATGASPDRPPPTSVGQRSGVPDVEGRVALRWRPSERRRLEVGLSGHAGRELWLLQSPYGDWNAAIDSWAGALDARLDFDWLTVQGGGFYGKNLDSLHTLAPGVSLSLDAAGRPIAATGVGTWGGWGQAVARPLPWLALLAGAGLEGADRADLPPNPAPATVPLQNLQVSGGAIADLSSRCQAGLEYTAYQTTWVDVPDRKVTSGQLQLSTRCAF